jgi:hypothetical protein
VGLAGAEVVTQQQCRFLGRPDNVALVESRTDISDRISALSSGTAKPPSRHGEMKGA